MATPVNMPQVGQDLETAKIMEWHVSEGDEVKVGDIIATVESDKSSFEVEAFEEGTVLKLLFEEGDEGYVFKPIAFIGKPGEAIPGNAAEEKEQPEQIAEPAVYNTIPQFSSNSGQFFSSPAARRIAAENNIDIQLVEPTGPEKRVIKRDVLAFVKELNQLKATPVAREIAKAEGINLSNLNGTGPSGRIHKTDVLNAVKKNAVFVVPAKDDEVIHFDMVRKIIADRLSLSKQTIPHYYLHIDVDVENAVGWKNKLQNEIGLKISINDILVYAVAKVLPRFRLLNAHVDREKVVVKANINIGIAVSTDAGLLVPVLANAGKKRLSEIAAEIRKLAEDARRGVVNPANQGTFTISNLGMFGISGFQAIINPPECALLSVGAIEKKVVPSGNGLKITDMVNIGLAVDHRAVDGAYAAQFLNELKTELINIKI